MEIHGMLDSLSGKVTGIENRFGRLEGKHIELDARMEVLDLRVKEIESDVEDMMTMLTKTCGHLGI